MQAQEECSKNKSRTIHILSVLIQTGLVQLFLWTVSSRQPSTTFNSTPTTYPEKALRALTWGLSRSPFHGKDSHFGNQIPSFTSPSKNLNFRGGIWLPHQKHPQNRISLFSFIENTSWTLSLWQSKIGSPYDKCIRLMFIQKKTIMIFGTNAQIRLHTGIKETSHNIQMKLHKKVMSIFKTRRSRKLMISISLTM